MGSSQSGFFRSEPLEEDARERRMCCGAQAEDEIKLLLEVEDPDALPALSEMTLNTTQSSGIIQMSCSMVFCREEEQKAVLDIVRFGDAAGRATVEYATVEGSAKAGLKYFHREGLVEFQPEETVKSIEVPIINDDSWDATLDFSVQLKNVRGAQLGMYLSSCRVSIIDDDCFPTNKYADYFERNDTHNIPDFGLFAQYCVMNLRNPIVKWGSIKTIFLDQIKNMYGIILLYLQMYLVDVVLTPEKEDNGEASESKSLIPNVLIIPDSRIYTAVVVGAIYIVPFLFLFLIDYQKLSFGVGGQSRLHLQSNLLRKFLNYKEEHRGSLSIGTITMTMVRDVPEIVNNGFMKALAIIHIFGSLLLDILFISSTNPMALVPISVLPVMMGIFLCCRGAVTVSTGHVMNTKQNEVVQTVTEATQGYRMVADFHLRPFMVSTYETRIQAFNSAGKKAAQVATINCYLAPCLTTLLIGGYMMISPFQLKAFGGSVSLGAFLATLNIFKQLGQELSEVYKEIMCIQQCIGPLRKVAHLMNLETDLVSRMNINRMRRREGEQRRQTARGVIQAVMTDKGEEVFAIDTIPVVLSDLSFSYPGKPALLQHIDIKLDQGKLHAFTGNPHEGKATLLQLIGQVLLPETSADQQQSNLFVPPHLRVLHLSTETFFVSGTLLHNLIFNTDLQKVGGIDRVKRICETLNFSKELLQEVNEPCLLTSTDGEDDDDDIIIHSWTTLLSHSDFARVNLARAFIMNPEFLVVHKPTMGFDDAERQQMLSLIRRHIEERGLQMPEETRQLRRRRTVLFSSTSEQGLLAADTVFEISFLRGVREISKQKAVEEFRKRQS